MHRELPRGSQCNGPEVNTRIVALEEKVEVSERGFVYKSISRLGGMVFREGVRCVGHFLALRMLPNQMEHNAYND